MHIPLGYFRSEGGFSLKDRRVALTRFSLGWLQFDHNSKMKNQPRQGHDLHALGSHPPTLARSRQPFAGSNTRNFPDNGINGLADIKVPSCTNLYGLSCGYQISA
ncbi:hypothetical protein EVAR_95002_1 [Eumeta japonica]|uniref:Uncharacterized protein n=1 Tax=Eumeta variegata TaxID=151549 RepID=A0A4C1UVW5_EUMVA|nr:hypothetical protein EVAR_95002_1 [Eumeta japonica]